MKTQLISKNNSHSFFISQIKKYATDCISNTETQAKYNIQPKTDEFVRRSDESDNNIAEHADKNKNIESEGNRSVGKIVEKDFGKKFFQKLEKEKSQKEYFAASVYNFFKVKTPDFKLLGSVVNPLGIEYEYIEDLKDIDVSDRNILKKICEDFGADVLLGNKNVLKSCKQDSNDNLIRIDLSDTLGNTIDEKKQPISSVAEEISDYFNSELYPENAQLFNTMTRDDFISSLKKIPVLKIENLNNLNTINDYSKTLNKSVYNNLLIKRKIFIRRALYAAQEIEQGSLTISEYAEKIKNEALKETILKSKNCLVLQDTAKAIENIKNNEVKTELKNLLAARLKELNPNLPNQITSYETGLLLKVSESPFYKLSEEEIKSLKEQFGEKYAKKIINIISQPINTSKILEITEIANKNNGKYLEFWRNNPDKMALYINSNATSNFQLYHFNNKAWDVVIGKYKDLFEKTDIQNAIKCIIEYSGFSGYDQFNGLLRFDALSKRILKKLNENTQKETLKSEATAIERITRRLYIGKTLEEKSANFKIIYQKTNDLMSAAENSTDINAFKTALTDLTDTINNISKELGYNEKIKIMEKLFSVATADMHDLKLRRTAITDEFEQLELDGQKLSKLMVEAGKNPELREKILKYFNEQQPIMFDAAFTSTSIEPYKTLSGLVEWKLRMNEGVKYTYVSDISHIFDYNNENTEAEILIFPKQKRKIISADYIKDKWVINAEIIP